MPYATDITFEGCYDMTIYVPENSVGLYQESYPWYYYNIAPMWRYLYTTIIDYEGYSLKFTATSMEPAECEVVCSTKPSTETSIVIPSTVTILGKEFAVTSIGDDAFKSCSSLTSIEIPSSVTSIGGSAFSDCSSLTSIEIPSGVTSIGGSAFSGCSSLTSIEIPSSVTSIGGSAFSGCSSLTSIEIPSGVTSIGDYAFAWCSNLTSIEIPSGVTYIGSSAFSDCSSLTSVFCLAEEVPYTDYDPYNIFYNNPFSGCLSSMTIYVPRESVDVYKRSTYWNSFAIKSITCEVTAVINPKEAGVVTGAGSYSVIETENVTLSATPNKGYEFVNWTENGNAVSEESEYTFEMTDDVEYVANFKLLDYNVVTSVNKDDAGLVIGSGIYSHGGNVTLTAIAMEGYKFVNWTEDGEVVSENAQYSFVVEGNRNLVANFEKKEVSYNVILLALDLNAGNVTGSGSYLEGETVRVVATPNAGYEFVSWVENGSVVSTEAEYSFEIADNRIMIANFTLIDYHIAAFAENSGEVVGTGDYHYGDNVTLIALPSEGYRFVSWTENGEVVSTEAQYSFTVIGNRDLVANFTLSEYNVTATVNINNAGMVSGSGLYPHGDNVSMIAMAADGYRFVNWTENDELVSEVAEYSFIVKNDRNLVANFVEKEKIYNVSLLVIPANTGTVVGAGSYIEGEIVTITATPNEGYRFVSWTEDGEVVSTESQYSFEIAGNRIIIANFELKSYNVTAIANIENSGTVTGVSIYSHGKNVTLSAIANAGYEFINWTENGVVASEEAEYSFIVTDNRNLVANFTLLGYKVATSVNIENAGVVIGSGTYSHGDNVTLTAIPIKNGYEFVSWTEHGEEVSTEAQYSFVVTSDRDLVANFELLEYYVSAAVNTAAAGEITGDGNYYHGDTVALVARANENYRFLNWTENGEVVSEYAQYSFVVIKDRNLVANFISTVGINEQSVVFNLYPIPSTDRLFIDTESYIEEISIYTLSGVMIYKEVDFDNKSVDVSNLNSGVYLIKIKSNDKVIMKRFVKE